MSVAHLGVVELGDVCRSMANRNGRWFELLGGWVADEPDFVAQRLFAEACHRHAWHADLWRNRTPKIPGAESVATPPAPAPEGNRAHAYRIAVAEIRSDLAALRARIDADLDPSTARVITLVDTDLTDLERRLDT